MLLVPHLDRMNHRRDLADRSGCGGRQVFFIGRRLDLRIMIRDTDILGRLRRRTVHRTPRYRRARRAHRQGYHNYRHSHGDHSRQQSTHRQRMGHKRRVRNSNAASRAATPITNAKESARSQQISASRPPNVSAARRFPAGPAAIRAPLRTRSRCDPR